MFDNYLLAFCLFTINVSCCLFITMLFICTRRFDGITCVTSANPRMAERPCDRWNRHRHHMDATSPDRAPERVSSVNLARPVGTWLYDSWDGKPNPTPHSRPPLLQPVYQSSRCKSLLCRTGPGVASPGSVGPAYRGAHHNHTIWSNGSHTMGPCRAVW